MTKRYLTSEGDDIPFDLNEHLRRAIIFSYKTWGPASNGTGEGCADHIRKELKELEIVEWNDLEEWIDVIILALDGAQRCVKRAYPESTVSETAYKVTSMLKFKQEKNMYMRSWPDWRTQDPNKAIGHVKSYDEDGRGIDVCS